MPKNTSYLASIWCIYSAEINKWQNKNQLKNTWNPPILNQLLLIEFLKIKVYSFLGFYKDLFLFLIVCIGMCLWVCMLTYAQVPSEAKNRETIRSLELELQGGFELSDIDGWALAQVLCKNSITALAIKPSF